MLSPAKVSWQPSSVLWYYLYHYRASNHVRQQMDYALSCIIVIYEPYPFKFSFFPNLILNHQTYRYLTIPLYYIIRPIIPVLADTLQVLATCYHSELYLSMYYNISFDISKLYVLSLSKINKHVFLLLYKSPVNHAYTIMLAVLVLSKLNSICK